jgi:hypothetical protein
METLGPVTFPATIPTVETDRLTLRACAPARLHACAPARLRACAPARLPACPPACPLARLPPARLPARSRRGWRGSGGSHLPRPPEARPNVGPAARVRETSQPGAAGARRGDGGEEGDFSRAPSPRTASAPRVAGSGYNCSGWRDRAGA